MMSVIAWGASSRLRSHSAFCSFCAFSLLRHIVARSRAWRPGPGDSDRARIRGRPALANLLKRPRDCAFDIRLLVLGRSTAAPDPGNLVCCEGRAGTEALLMAAWTLC